MGGGSSMRGGGGGGPAGMRFAIGGLFGDDLFSLAFGGGADGPMGMGMGMGMNRQMKAAPIERTLPCSLEELYKGTTKKMKISREIADASGHLLLMWGVERTPSLRHRRPNLSTGGCSAASSSHAPHLDSLGLRRHTSSMGKFSPLCTSRGVAFSLVSFSSSAARQPSRQFCKISSAARQPSLMEARCASIAVRRTRHGLRRPMESSSALIARPCTAASAYTSASLGISIA